MVYECFLFPLQRIPNFITNINSTGSRIIVHDVQESFHFLKYRPKENQLVIFADDVNPRYLFTDFCVILMMSTEKIDS